MFCNEPVVNAELIKIYFSGEREGERGGEREREGEGEGERERGKDRKTLK